MRVSHDEPDTSTRRKLWTRQRSYVTQAAMSSDGCVGTLGALGVVEMGWNWPCGGGSGALRRATACFTRGAIGWSCVWMAHKKTLVALLTAGCRGGQSPSARSPGEMGLSGLRRVARRKWSHILVLRCAVHGSNILVTLP